MAKKSQTEKAKYFSCYANGYVSAAQYITELICVKKASGDLPDKFWELPEWKMFYRNQIIAANGLLKVYDEIPIINALKRPGVKLFSLRSPLLDQLIKEEEAKIRANPKKEIVANNTEKVVFNRRSNNSSKLDLLRDIDNGEESDKDNE